MVLVVQAAVEMHEQLLKALILALETIHLHVQLMEPLKEMMVVKEVLLLVKPEVVAVEEEPLVQLAVALVLHKVEMVVMV